MSGRVAAFMQWSQPLLNYTIGIQKPDEWTTRAVHASHSRVKKNGEKRRKKETKRIPRGGSALVKSTVAERCSRIIIIFAVVINYIMPCVMQQLWSPMVLQPSIYNRARGMIRRSTRVFTARLPTSSRTWWKVSDARYTSRAHRIVIHQIGEMQLMHRVLLADTLKETGWHNRAFRAWHMYVASFH